MLLILNDMYNRTWSNIMIPGFQAVFIVSNILTLYGTIRFSASLELFVYFWCPTLAILFSGIMGIIPPVFASLYNISLNIIRKSVVVTTVAHGGNQNILEIQVFRRIYKSFRPLKCKAGNMVVYKRITGLICFNYICEKVAFCLLSG